jgi:hypothetical protein
MKLGAHMHEAGLTLKAVGEPIGCGPETVRRHCLPADHPDFRMPRRKALVHYYVMSRGAVTPNDFCDLPDLSTFSQGEAA